MRNILSVLIIVVLSTSLLGCTKVPKDKENDGVCDTKCAINDVSPKVEVKNVTYLSALRDSTQADVDSLLNNGTIKEVITLDDTSSDYKVFETKSKVTYLFYIEFDQDKLASLEFNTDKYVNEVAPQIVDDNTKNIGSDLNTYVFSGGISEGIPRFFLLWNDGSNWYYDLFSYNGKGE